MAGLHNCIYCAGRVICLICISIRADCTSLACYSYISPVGGWVSNAIMTWRPPPRSTSIRGLAGHGGGCGVQGARDHHLKWYLENFAVAWKKNSSQAWQHCLVMPFSAFYASAFLTFMSFSDESTYEPRFLKSGTTFRVLQSFVLRRRGMCML